MSQKHIPFANPHAAYLLRRQAIVEAATRAFDSGRYILGEEVATFENKFASYLGLASVAGCASGTDAIELALRALGVGEGKAVFTVSHTAVATVAAIHRAGGTPVLVDIDPGTYTMSPDSLAQALKYVHAHHQELEPFAVIPVHLYGHPCNMDPILELARKYGCHVIEDCAQAHGARYKGKLVGTMGTVAAFSFYPTKNLGALGDAGCVATNDVRLAETISAMRQYGWKQRYISSITGINSRLDPVQAAILSVQLDFLDVDNASRRRIAAAYNKGLADCEVSLPQVAQWAESVFHLYVIRTARREQLAEHLKARGIGCAVHYPLPVHLQPAYCHVAHVPNGLTNTEKAAQEILSLPMFPQLEDISVTHIIETTRNWRVAP